MTVTVNKISISQQTPHTLPFWASYGVSIVRIWEKNWCYNGTALYFVLKSDESESSHDLHVNGLVQERRNSIADALELRLSCTSPSI